MRPSKTPGTVAANIPCQAVGCKQQATRWTNLCGLCERQFLEDMKPVFGKPSADQLAAAQAVIRDQFAQQIAKGVLDDWSSQIGRTFITSQSSAWSASVF